MNKMTLISLDLAKSVSRSTALPPFNGRLNHATFCMPGTSLLAAVEILNAAVGLGTKDTLNIENSGHS